jgi:molybdopterin synthase sulfur carrier subunit
VARVLLFGRLADLAGWRTREVEPLPRRLSDLRDLLGRQDAALREALTGRGVRAAVDKALVGEDIELAGASEIAFMPPMSGG